MVRYITMGYEEIGEDIGKLTSRALAILEVGTDSKLVGPPYGGSSLKRVPELLFSTIAGTLALPAVGYWGFRVWLEDRHWPFVDIGNPLTTGSHTHVWKLRTMVPGAKDHEVEALQGLSPDEFKSRGLIDPRVTKVGAELREKPIADDLLQFVNVALGHLALVGPRFPVESDLNAIFPYQDKEPYKTFIKLARGEGLASNEKCKFGLIGFRELFGIHELSNEARVHLAVLYWQQQNFKADFLITAKTIAMLSKLKKFPNSQGLPTSKVE